MKLIKFMCAAFAAMVAFAGCQKEQAPVENKTLKSVEVQINNVFPGTKAIGGVGDLEGQNIQLNSVQFFFSDGTAFYEAKDVNGNKADVYFDATELAAMSGNISAKFHFLPAAVKKVIVVGNFAASPATQETQLDTELEIINYQNVKNFPLYAEGTLGVPQSNIHNNDENGNHLSNVYSVNLNIVPHVARFEIKGLGCTIPTGSDKIIKVVSIAFADFYDKCDFRTSAPSTLRSVQLTQQDIFNYFQNQIRTDKWNNDFFNGLNGQEGAGNSHPLAEFTATNPSMTTDIAYNFFCKSAPSPTLLLNVIEYENQAALEANNGVPGYLYTNTYRLNSTEAVTTFEPGKIYRMNINFKEDDLQHQDRCLDITLEVAKWLVINVTPEF
jgi:hypothetical protein